MNSKQTKLISLLGLLLLVIMVTQTNALMTRKMMLNKNKPTQKCTHDICVDQNVKD